MENIEKNIHNYELFLREEEASTNTINTYIYGIKQYYKYFGELSKENLLNYKDWLIKKFKGTTVNLRILGINKYCKFLEIDLKLKKIKTKSSMHTENVITMEEYINLKNGLFKDNKKWYFLVRLLAETGMRVSEFRKIKVEDIKNGKAILFSKGNKIRNVYFKNQFCNEFLEYLEQINYDKEYIATNRFGDVITSRGVLENLRNFGRKYGIREEAMHPHSFRHFFAINFLKNNQNISLLADLMGHSNVATTSLYLRLNENEQKNELEKIVTW